MMTKEQKYRAFYLILGAFWALGNAPGLASSILLDVPVDNHVLVSKARNSYNSYTSQKPIKSQLQALKPESGVNLEPTLVYIKVTDSPRILTEGSKTGIATPERNGQGIIIDPTGIIATNRHIIENAQHIYVTLASGEVFEAQLLRNSQADLCLIKITAPYPLRAVSLADSSQIQIGNPVLAITNGASNPQRKLSGQIISLFEETASKKVELLEMNIPLNPGDSGGPILNQQGSLLGLIMGKSKSIPNKSYAIASNLIQQEYSNYRNSV